MQQKPMSIAKRIAAAFGAIIMLFSGGCILFAGGNYINDINSTGEDYSIIWVLVIAANVIAFLFGLLMFRLARRSATSPDISPKQ